MDRDDDDLDERFNGGKRVSSRYQGKFLSSLKYFNLFFRKTRLPKRNQLSIVRFWRRQESL